ncbi:MAG: hypothetical protein IJ191_09485 [Treponema sp.]|nr:hypothetical protein [Treponema sp.]
MDVLAVVPFVALGISVLNVLASRADFFSVTLLLFSALTAFVNIRALLRYVSHLYIDRYSVLLIVPSAIVLAGVLVLTGVLVYFRPVVFSAADFGVTERIERLSGSRRSGFFPSTRFEPAQLFLTTVSPAPEKARADAPVVVVLPDKRGDTAAYRPYLFLLAQRGYTVVAADIYADDMRYVRSLFGSAVCRRCAVRALWHFSQESFDEWQTAHARTREQEAHAVVELVRTRTGGVPFIVSDGMMDEAAYAVLQQPERIACGVFALDTVQEYGTPGFGNLEQVQPFLARLFFGLPRDESYFIARYLVLKTEQAITASLPYDDTLVHKEQNDDVD